MGAERTRCELQAPRTFAGRGIRPAPRRGGKKLVLSERTRRNPTPEEKVDFRDLPITTTQKEILALTPPITNGELKHLDRKQRAAIAEADLKAG